MNKKEFDDMYVGKKLVVHCDTEEKANEFLKLADSFGYKWISGGSYHTSTKWEIYEEDTCYMILDGQVSPKEFFIDKGYTVVEFNPKTEFSKGDMVVVVDDGGAYEMYEEFVEFFAPNRIEDYKGNPPEENKTYNVVKRGMHGKFGHIVLIIEDNKTKEVFVINEDCTREYDKKAELREVIRILDDNGISLGLFISKEDTIRTIDELADMAWNSRNLKESIRLMQALKELYELL